MRVKSFCLLLLLRVVAKPNGSDEYRYCNSYFFAVDPERDFVYMTVVLLWYF